MKILSLASLFRRCGFVSPRPVCQAMHARVCAPLRLPCARVSVHTPSPERPLSIGFTAFIYVVTRSRKTLFPPFSSRFFPFLRLVPRSVVAAREKNARPTRLRTVLTVKLWITPVYLTVEMLFSTEPLLRLSVQRPADAMATEDSGRTYVARGRDDSFKTDP